MRGASFCYGLACLVLLTVQVPAHAQGVEVVGTDHFLNRAGPAQPGAPARPGVGPAVDLVHEVLRRAGVEHTVAIYPWARAYSMAQTQPNVLILSMARTPEREKKFRWVGEIAPVTYSLFKLRSRTDIRVNSLDEAKKYQIGVVNQDVAHLHLMAKGFGPNLLQLTTDYLQTFRKLLAGRVDLVPRSQLGFRQFCDEAPGDCDKIDSAYTMDDMSSSLYMAFSLQTSDDIFLRTKKAYDEIRADGTWKKLMAPALQR